MSSSTEPPDTKPGSSSRSTAGLAGTSWGSDWTLPALLERLGFWSAVVLPVVAVALLVVQPVHWPPLLAGVFALAGISLLVGHCHGLEC